MSIIPSGKVRIMVAQEGTFKEELGGGLMDNALRKGKLDHIAPRPKIEQEPAQAQGDPQENQTPETANYKFPSQDTQKESPYANDSPGDQGNTLKDYFFSKLKELGVPDKNLVVTPGKKSPIFEMKLDLNNKTSSGFYMIPGYTRTRKISERDAGSIAEDIGNKFSLHQHLSHFGNNYKIEFKTEVKTNTTRETSFDELSSPDTGYQKAAFTTDDYIKMGKIDLVNKLRKISGVK